MLPAGFGCVSSGLDDEEVQATGQHVRCTLQGEAISSPYIANPPSEKGAYSFSGMLRDSDRKDTPIGGASWGRATVQQPSNPGPLCAPRTTRPPFLSRRRPFSPGSPAGSACHRRQLFCRSIPAVPQTGSMERPYLRNIPPLRKVCHRRCAINVNFRYGAGLQLYQDQGLAPGGCLRDEPRVPADAAPQGGRTPGSNPPRRRHHQHPGEGAGANLYGGRFPKAGLAKRQLQ